MKFTHVWQNSTLVWHPVRIENTEILGLCHNGLCTQFHAGPRKAGAELTRGYFRPPNAELRNLNAAYGFASVGNNQRKGDRCKFGSLLYISSENVRITYRVRTYRCILTHWPRVMNQVLGCNKVSC